MLLCMGQPQRRRAPPGLTRPEPSDKAHSPSPSDPAPLLCSVTFKLAQILAGSEGCPHVPTPLPPSPASAAVPS